MKKLVLLSGLLLLLVTACQSTDIGSKITEPIRNTPINIFDTVIKVQALDALEVTVDSGNLFSNGGFESGLDSWGACDSDNISVTNKPYEGNNALSLEAGNCFYQSVEASVDQEFNLSCFVNILSGQDWTGMGLSFSDSNWNKISDATPAIITGTGYNQYNVSGKAPANASYVSMWLYSENPTVVDNCTLMLNEPPPPPPPAPNSNLLENGDFEISIVSGQDSFWTFGCADLFSEIDPSFADVYEGNYAINLQDRTCMDQSLSASDIESLKGKEYTYSCYVKNLRSYGSISIFFDDQPIFQEVENSTSYQLVEIKGTAPANMTNGFVSAYADDLMSIDSCSLKVEGALSTEPVIINESRLLETDGTSFDIEGNTMVVGFPADDTLGENSGKVEIYQKTIDGWMKESEILSSSTTTGIGKSVKLYNNEIYAASSRYIEIYAKNLLTNQWELTQTLEDPNWFESFQNPGPITINSGYSGGINIQVSDNTIVTSAYRFTGNGIALQQNLTVPIFTKIGNNNQWQYTKTLSGQQFINANTLKLNVLLDNDNLFVSTGDNVSSENTFSYFRRNIEGANSWGFSQKIAVPDPQVSFDSGQDFVRVGNYLIVKSKTATQLYEFTSNSEEAWTLVGDFTILFPELPATSIYLGSSNNRLFVSNLDREISYFQQNMSELIIYVLDTSESNYENWKIIAEVQPQNIGENDNIIFDRRTPIDDSTFVLQNSTNESNQILTFDIP